MNKTLTASNGRPISFIENLVADAPIILFFHGQGETGDGTQNTLPNIVGNMPKPVGFTIIAPQLHRDFIKEWPIWYATEMIKYIRSFTTKPILCTGLSLGGGLVWNVLDDDYCCSQIAAAVPVCGTATFDSAKYVKQYNVPVWAFHAKDDGTIGVGNTYAFVMAIEQVGGNAKKTIYTSGGHGIWSRAYETVRQTYATTDEWNSKFDTSKDPTIYDWFKGIISGLPPVTPPPPPPPTVKTIKSVTINYSDGTSETKP